MELTRRSALQMSIAPMAAVAAAAAPLAAAPAAVVTVAAPAPAPAPAAPAGPPVAPSPAVRRVRRGHVRHDGQTYRVNAHWHRANTETWPHLAARTREELRAIQDELLLKSNNPLTPLSRDELAYLRAANNHFDVRTSIGLLRGRDHREFGFKGADQVHMNSIGYTCGCRLLIVFDHHKARTGEVDKVHPHTPLAVCDDHAAHRHDLALLHDRVAADSLTRAAPVETA